MRLVAHNFPDALFPSPQQTTRRNMSASPPSPKLVLDLLNGFRSSKVLFVLVKLGIPDLIEQKQKQQQQQTPQQTHLVSAEDLAKSLAASPAAARAFAKAGPGGVVAEPSIDGLTRLLDAAVGLDLLGGGKAQGGYSLTDVTKAYLLSDAEGSLAGYVQHSDMLYTLWGELETAVLTGSNVWQAAFGLDSADVFGSLYTGEAAMLRFMRGMDGFSQLSAHAVLTAFDLSRFKVLVDLGGATGALAAAACSLYPGMRSVVVDLPHVVQLAQQHFGQRPAALAAGESLSWVAGDFFGAPEQLPQGDLFVLARILHDWDEERCRKLLQAVYELLPEGGALLVAEMLLDEGGTSPPEVLLQSLNMLSQTHGRERRLSEYATLLQSVGFAQVEGKKTGTYLDAVIAYKTAAGPQGS